MSDLFMERTALLSGPGGCYRDELRRVWNRELPLLVVCMLNPSTADHLVDDPTVQALMHFGRLWGFGGLLIVNLYSIRTSSPKAMMAHADPVGAGSADSIQSAIEYARKYGGRLLVAWGNDGAWEARDEWFCSRATSQGVSLICLGRTSSGAPKHPMARGRHRVPRDQQPVLYRHNAQDAVAHVASFHGGAR
jgi:hypothetical protein